MFLFALIFLFFTFFSAQPARADTLPTTPCDSAFISGPHLTVASTLEYGTTTFEYTGAGQQFASATSGIITLNFHTIFNASATSTAGVKLVGMRADCSYIGGFAATFNTPSSPADHVMALDNTTVTLDGTVFNMTPSGHAGYIWLEVGNPGGSIASYSYLVDIKNIQNPIPTPVTPPTPVPPPAPPPPPEESGGGGSVSGAITAPKILRFESDKMVVKEGETVILSWETVGAEYVTLDGIGLVAKTGSQTVTASGTFIYNLTALGAGGETKAALTVEVLPRDPVVIVPGILGSAKDSAGNLTLDPILHTYDGLWEGLKSVGYEEGKNLFAFPYDWRKSNVESARLLGEKIEKILEICGCEKVDVVAHSMGGLVTRYYIQNINNQTVDQLIFLGTPHLGAPKAYLAWEAGEMGPDRLDILIEKSLEFEGFTQGYLNVVDYIHDKVESINQLLPTFKYLTNYDTGELYDYIKCKEELFTCNDFLDDLNRPNTAYENIEVHNLINDNSNTIRGFVVEKADPLKTNKWEHGIPIDYPKRDGIIYGGGDGTVPVNSASVIKQEYTPINSPHDNLPNKAQSEISGLLVNREIKNPGKTKFVKRVLFIGIKSPADISVDCGCEYYYSSTEDPEYIVIPDPVDGEYKINVTGTGEGHFEVEASLIGDDLKQTKTFEGMIKPGEVYVLSTSISATSTQDIIVLQSPLPPVNPITPVVLPGPIPSIIPLTPIKLAINPNKSQDTDPQTLITSTSTIPTSSPSSGEDRGEGAVLGISTPSPKPSTPNPILYLISSLAILIAGYLTFKKQKV